MITTSDSISLSTHKNKSNRFRMHQKDDNVEATKVIIGFTSVVDSSIRMGGGTGTFDDMVILASSLKFCEDKLALNPRLGFKEDLSSIRVSLGNIGIKANSCKQFKSDDWISPFVTKDEQRDIENLVFLIRNQFVGSPVLDTNKTLDEHFVYACNNSGN